MTKPKPLPRDYENITAQHARAITPKQHKLPRVGYQIAFLYNENGKEVNLHICNSAGSYWIFRTDPHIYTPILYDTI